VLACLVSVFFTFDSVFLPLVADKYDTGGGFSTGACFGITDTCFCTDAGFCTGALAARAISMLFKEVKGGFAMNGSSIGKDAGDDVILAIGSPCVGAAAARDCFRVAEIITLGCVELRKKSFLGKESLLVERDAGSST